MLVRFLSYAASAFGSARQRAILASYLVLIFACAGIFSVYQMNDTSSDNAANSTELGSQTNENQQNPVWVSDRQVEQRDKQKPDSSAASDTSDEENANTDTAPDNEQTTVEPELELSTTEVILSAGGTSDDMAARVNGDVENELTWSIELDEATNDDFTVINGEQLENSTLFQIKASTSVKPGTYLITVSAKNTEIELSKTLDITVQ